MGCDGATPGSVWVSLLALCSGISPGGAEGAILDPRNQIVVGHLQDKINILSPIQFSLTLNLSFLKDNVVLTDKK